jgi:uncharacterized protein (DUF697 family)
MEDTQKEIEKIIKQHVAWSVGAGLVPIPVLDILAVTAIQLDMLKQLCRVYGINYFESSGKAMLSTVTGSTLARVGASMIKAVPGVGTILGTVSMPVLSGASTYAIAHAATWHFESGGDLLNIDFSKIKDVYKEHFKKGKEVALQLHKKQKSSSSYEETVQKLEKLLQLKEKGVITEEEFETQKQKLLESL